MLYSLLSLSEIITIFICLIFTHKSIKTKSLESEIPYQISWLLVAIIISLAAAIMIFIAQINLDSLPENLRINCWYLDQNYRIALIILLLAKFDFFILYFTRFRFVRAIKVNDKITSMLMQIFVYSLQFAFIFSLILGPKYDNPDLYEYIKFGNFSHILYQFPENPATDKFIDYVFICFFALSLVPIRTILSKHIIIKVMYFIFLSIIVQTIFHLFNIVSNSMSPLYISIIHIIITISNNVMFILLIFTGRLLNDNNKHIVSK